MFSTSRRWMSVGMVAAAVCASGTARAEDAAPAAAVVATVNGTKITEAQLAKDVEMYTRRMEGQVPPEQMSGMKDYIRKSALESLVTRQALLDEADKKGIKVSDEEMAKAVAEVTENLPPGKTLKDLLAAHGLTEADFNEQVKTGLRVANLIKAEAGPEPDVTADEVEAFYKGHPEYFSEPEKVTASHILIGVEPDATPEAKAAAKEKLTGIRQKILDGASFEDMAKQFSSCPSKDQGGSLGSFERGSMVPEFEEAAFTQKIGDVGELVETQFGYHLIRVDAREAGKVTPLEDAQAKIKEFLGYQKQEQASKTYVEALRAKAVVTYPEAAAAAPAVEPAKAPAAQPAADDSKKTSEAPAAAPAE